MNPIKCETCGGIAHVTVKARKAYSLCAFCANGVDLGESVEVEDIAPKGSASLLVTSVRLYRLGRANEVVTVWNAGARAGQLVVRAGDGMLLAVRLLGVPL